MWRVCCVRPDVHHKPHEHLAFEGKLPGTLINHTQLVADYAFEFCAAVVSVLHAFVREPFLHVATKVPGQQLEPTVCCVQWPSRQLPTRLTRGDIFLKENGLRITEATGEFTKECMNMCRQAGGFNPKDIGPMMAGRVLLVLPGLWRKGGGCPKR